MPLSTFSFPHLFTSQEAAIMAALAQVFTSDRIPQGRYVEASYRVTSGVGSATSWIATGFSTILAVVGYALQGTSTATAGVSFVLNARGTGVTEDVNPGDLGIETEAAEDIFVTVRGLV